LLWRQKYYIVSTRENVRIHENGRLNKTCSTVDNYGRYLIFRGENNRSSPVENNAQQKESYSGNYRPAPA
jgi:hypothetical protein